MANETTLSSLSAELADVVARVAPSIVRVDDGSRLTATGIVWSADGVILTTSHGVECDENLVVEFADGTRLLAALVGRDNESDLAVLRVEAIDLAAVTLADPAEVKVGHLALALGRPGEAGLQATLGIISARQEAEDNGRAEYILHTDATLYPGFSGGPLVNVQGQVVGLANLSFGRGMGVALGTPILSHVAEVILRGGGVSRGYLGISTQIVALPESLKTALGAAQERGLLVVQVESSGPADQSGIFLGDIVLSIGGQSVQDVDDLRRQLRSSTAGEAVAIQIVRGGQRHDLSVTLGARQ